MKKYYVSVPEVWYSTYLIEANDKDDAVRTMGKLLRTTSIQPTYEPEFSHSYHNGETGFYEVEEVDAP